MGQSEDCVVDAALCVRNIAGLRVADASVMPGNPSRAPQRATVMAIAGKAAKLIRAE